MEQFNGAQSNWTGLIPRKSGIQGSRFHENNSLTIGSIDFYRRISVLDTAAAAQTFCLQNHERTVAKERNRFKFLENKPIFQSLFLIPQDQAMRIPTKALSFYISESDHKSFAEDASTNPVDGPTRLRAALSSTHSGQKRSNGKDKSSAQEHSETQGKSGSDPDSQRPDRASPNNGVRQFHDRRKEICTIVLDTRLTQRRLDPASPPKIDVEI